MNLDSEGLEVLSRSECIELIRSVPIGRIVFTHQALPAVRPVNFSVVDGTVVIPTRPGSNLAAAAQDAVVAFQADAFDACASSGWSVTVVGHAEVVHDDADGERGETGAHADGFASGLRRDGTAAGVRMGAGSYAHAGDGTDPSTVAGGLAPLAHADGDGAGPDRCLHRARCESDGFIRIALDQVSGRRTPAR